MQIGILGGLTWPWLPPGIACLLVFTGAPAGARQVSWICRAGRLGSKWRVAFSGVSSVLIAVVLGGVWWRRQQAGRRGFVHVRPGRAGWWPSGWRRDRA